MPLLLSSLVGGYTSSCVLLLVLFSFKPLLERQNQKLNLRAARKMKQNSCRLKLSAGTAGTGTCPGKCHLDLEKHMPLLVGVLLRFWGESSSFELCRSSSDAES